MALLNLLTMKKNRIDIMLVEMGLADSRSKAQRLVMAGQVRVNGQVVQKPSNSFSGEVDISVATRPKYVSRGGDKLEAAINTFQIEVEGFACADVGASTGGFTDCLLAHGARKVLSIDVGKGILHWKLRQNEKVVALEGVNARNLDRLPEEVDLVTIDASFISSKVLLPVVQGWFGDSRGQVILLIKPQFEAGRSEVSRGKGVIRDSAVHRQVLIDVLEFAQEIRYKISGLVQSPLLGPKGNKEFLAWLAWPGQKEVQVKKLVDQLFTD
jgi:23S rRNA (cytidine1920-2'-O)/16S rRNA (cytidine1409-2'-O)-methyltransferase